MTRILFFIISALIITAVYFSGKEYDAKVRKRRNEAKKRIEELEKRVDNLDTIIKNRKYKETRQWQ